MQGIEALSRTGPRDSVLVDLGYCSLLETFDLPGQPAVLVTSSKIPRYPKALNRPVKVRGGAWSRILTLRQ